MKREVDLETLKPNENMGVSSCLVEHIEQIGLIGQRLHSLKTADDRNRRICRLPVRHSTAGMCTQLSVVSAQTSQAAEKAVFFHRFFQQVLREFLYFWGKLYVSENIAKSEN
jgi:hypothetical protein